MRHTDAQVEEALRLVPISDPKARAAWERQLRADDAGAWFVVAGRKRRIVAAADDVTRNAAIREGDG